LARYRTGGTVEVKPIRERRRIVAHRLPLEQLGLGTGKKARLHRILYRHGLANGTAIFLPYDQGLEHGPRDFFANPAAGDPRYIVKLALEGGFNGIAVQIGLAEKFYWEYAGEVPLILKLNGKTEIPSDAAALSPVHASVADAVRLGADAVGYTLYVGTPAQEQDFAQYRTVREDAHRLGMPLVVWAYPRGEAVNAKGGKDSFYAVHYAARVASELGADVVKVNFPHPEKRVGVPRAYDAEFSAQQAIDAVVRSANRTLLLVSGASRRGTRPCWTRRAGR
jgi:fructose-bisphosphate aldolase, class I